MNMIKARGLIFSVISLVTVSCLADQGHRFVELNQKEFLTRQEREYFFAQHGVGYLNDIVIEYEPCKSVNFKEMQGYLSHQEYYDRLSELYSGHIANKTLAPMSIRWINSQVGYGVFAESNIRKGDFIGIYGGVVVEESPTRSNDYAWNFPMPDKKIMLDAIEYGNEISLVNDGKNPNCAMAQILGRDGACYICYIATRDIAVGEQFLVSYGPGYWQSRGYAYQEMGQAPVADQAAE